MTTSALLVLPCLVQGAALPPTAVEQDTLPDANAFIAPPIDTVFYDEPGDGRLWVRGSDYKASFGAEGATFIPFLGSDASRNWPATFQLDEVTIGGQPLELASTQRSREEDLVTLDRGSVSERYEIALDSIEQSFAFESLPGSGELVLRLGVESDLEPVADGAGWRFEGPEGGFDYGAATVLDAAGASLALESEWDGRALVFRVPADFVAAATLPLVVDPVLGTGTVADLASNERSADVAYDPTWGKYMVSVEYAFSSSDSDVRLYEVNETGPGTVGLNGTWMDVTNDSWQRPRIACRNQGNAFMVVATVGTGLSRYVVGRVRDVDVAVINPSFVVSGALTDSYNPDVGGDGRGGFASGAPGFIVVWEKAWTPGVDHDIYMRSYNNIGQPLTLPATVAQGIGQLFARPVISKSAGPSSPYNMLVAWERWVNSSNRTIQARYVSIAGSTVGGAFNVSNGGFARQAEVSAISTVTVAGQSERACVVVYTHGATEFDHSDIHAVVCSGTVAHAPTNISEAEGVDPSTPRITPCVSCDGDQWIIAYSEQVPGSPSNHDVFMTTANLVGDRLGLSERHEVLGDASTFENDPRIASKWAGGGAPSPSNMDESFVVWLNDRASNDGIQGGHVGTSSALVAGRQYCWATENSTGQRGWLAAYGDSSTTGPKVLFSFSLPMDSLAFYLVSPGDGFFMNLGGGMGNLCLDPASLGRYSSAAASTGASGTYVHVVDPTQISQPMGAVAATSGQTWYFQCWHRDAVGGMVTSNTTNAVAIPFQ